MKPSKNQTLSSLFFNNLQPLFKYSGRGQIPPLQSPSGGPIGHTPDLGPIGGDHDLLRRQKDPENRFQSASVQFGIRIVQEIDRIPFGASEKLPSSCGEKQSQDLSFAGGTDPPNTPTVEEDLNII